MRKKTYVVISTLVDNTLGQLQPDIIFKVFSSVKDFESKLSVNPIRADNLYITKEVLGTTLNVFLTAIASHLNTTYCRINGDIFYISDKDCIEEEYIQFFEREINRKVDVIKGNLSTDYVSNFITGALNTDDLTAEEMVRVRISKQDYAEYTLNKSEEEVELLEGKYTSDEASFSDVNNEEVEKLPILSFEGKVEQRNVCGLDTLDRKIFVSMLAQYLSVKGKTIIIESDLEYLTLSHLIVSADIDCLKIDMKDLYLEPSATFALMKNTTKKLIAIISYKKAGYNYDFVQQMIYYAMTGYAQYLIYESNLETTNFRSEYIVLMSNKIPDILKTLSNLRINITDNTQFALIDTNNISSIAVRDSIALTALINEVMEVKIDKDRVNIFEVNSLKFGGSNNDLQMYS